MTNPQHPGAEGLTDEQIEWSTVPHPFRGSVGFERGARWAESRHLAALAAPQAPAVQPDCRWLRTAIHVTESGAGKYAIVLRFKDMTTMHLADDELRKILAPASHPAETKQEKP